MTQTGNATTATDPSTRLASEPVTGGTIRRSAEQVLDDVPFFGRMVPDPAARKQLLDSLVQVPLPEAIARELARAQDAYPETYLHLVRTAIIAAWLGRTPTLTRCDVTLAATAGLLHDLGMLRVDRQILDPDHVLTPEQRRQLYAHPLLSAKLMGQHDGYDAQLVRAVAEHHECLDGSGYPRNLVGDAISPLGQILSLAQVVAAMFAPGRGSLEMRLSVLLRMTSNRFDAAMAMQILSALKPHLDVMSVELQLLDNPIPHLCEITRLLRQWPLKLDDDAELPAARAAAMVALATHAAQIQRVLAGVGAVPEQLELLQGGAQDDALQAELSLLTREASWQLCTLARETRRRWQVQADEVHPVPLAQWLCQVDNLVADVSRPPPGGAAARHAG